MQHAVTGAWNKSGSYAVIPSTPEERAAEYASWQFFLLEAERPGVPAKGKHLIPLSSTETLAQALSGRTVVEFPTIYVFQPSTPLPDGFALGSAARRKRKREEMPEDDDDSARQPRQKIQHLEPAERPPRGKWDLRGSRGGRGRGGRGGRGTKRITFENRPPPGDSSSEEGEIGSDNDAGSLDELAHGVRVDNQQMMNSNVDAKLATNPVGKGPGKANVSLVNYDSSDSE